MNGELCTLSIGCECESDSLETVEPFFHALWKAFLLIEPIELTDRFTPPKITFIHRMCNVRWSFFFSSAKKHCQADIIKNAHVTRPSGREREKNVSVGVHRVDVLLRVSHCLCLTR